MSFFQRLLSHVVNQVLVETLANSRTFQRFAVRSSVWMQDASKKTAEQQLKLQEFAKWFTEHPSASKEEIESVRKRLTKK
ncbi:hypothetical protein WJX81_007072 [Elliptochloris bilobata]|uniref:Uncharacterized protein n=1 Tax=Elliptochloris bilobata TaxID=381761 RepID=A0AAW1QI30_9CHLO